MGWFTVVAYLATAGLAAACYRAQSQDRLGPAETDPDATLPDLRFIEAAKRARRRAFAWAGFTLVLVALGINKQLDLQSLVTETGRWLAHRGDWYENRSQVQVVFVLSVIATGTIGLVTGIVMLKGELETLGVPLLGMALVLVFVAVRASSLQYVDQLIGWQLAGFRMNWALELGGIFIIAAGAVLALRRARRQRPLE